MKEEKGAFERTLGTLRVMSRECRLKLFKSVDIK
jgi:hypothetical protein